MHPWDPNLSWLSLVKYVNMTNSNTFQNKIFPEFRYQLKTFQFQEIHMYDFNKIAELRKTCVAQKRNRAVLHKINFPNDCANCFFSRKLMRNKIFCVLFCKNCAKVFRIETLVSLQSYGYNFSCSCNKLAPVW